MIDIHGKTLFTILTYHHGHFRPSVMNYLKLLFPSPLQSNWRFYLDTVNRKNVNSSVWFLKNIMNNSLYAVGTHLASDIMQTHRANSFSHFINENTVETEITSGVGSSPGFSCRARVTDDLEVPDELLVLFGSHKSALNYLCLQHSAISEGIDFVRQTLICRLKLTRYRRLRL